MTGLVCALSPERMRLVFEDPELVHDLADRTIEVPGRHFFDALHLPQRLGARLPRSRLVVALLQTSLGEGIGAKGAWAYGRPKVVAGDTLAVLGAELDALPEAPMLLAARAADPDLDPIDTEIAEADDAFLVRLRTLVGRERARAGALLVHVT